MGQMTFAIRIDLLRKAGFDENLRQALINYLNKNLCDLTLLDLDENGQIIATCPIYQHSFSYSFNQVENLSPCQRKKCVELLISKGDSHLYYSANSAIEEILSIAGTL